MIKAVLMDLDDTILRLDVDWSTVKSEIMNILTEHGKKPNEGIAKTQIEYKGTETGNEIDRMVEKHEAGGWKTSRLLPHAKETIQELSKQYKLAIVTGNGRLAAEKSLKHHGIIQYFATIASRENGIKPEPAPILKALKDLDCEKEEAVMVGNSDSDMLAAKAAGVKGIGYTSTMSSEELKGYGAEITINDLIELKEVLK